MAKSREERRVEGSSDLDVVGKPKRIIPGKTHAAGRNSKPNPQSASSVIQTTVIEVEHIPLRQPTFLGVKMNTEFTPKMVE